MCFNCVRCYVYYYVLQGKRHSKGITVRLSASLRLAIVYTRLQYRLLAGIPPPVNPLPSAGAHPPPIPSGAGRASRGTLSPGLRPGLAPSGFALGEPMPSLVCFVYVLFVYQAPHTVAACVPSATLAIAIKYLRSLVSQNNVL